MSQGLFPSAPEAPHYAFAIDFLDFYYHMFKHSADSAEAAAATLSSFHRQYGFVVENDKASMRIDVVWLADKWS